MRKRNWLFGLAAGLVVLLLAAADGWTKGKPGGGGGGGGDTSRIAFRGWSIGTGGGIFVISPGGSGLTQLTTSGERPRWSADGSVIAYSDVRYGGGTTTTILRVSDGAVLYSYALAWPVRWSRQEDGDGALLPPEDQLLAYSDGGANVWVREADGTGTPVNLTGLGTSGNTRERGSFPSWLPADGGGNARIAYVKTVDDVTVPGSPVLISNEVRVMTLDTSSWPSVSVLSDDGISGWGPSDPGLSEIIWDRGATQVIWRDGITGFYLAPVTESAGAFSIDWDSAVLIADNDQKTYWTRTPTFSPDGGAIAFVANKRPNQYYPRLWSVNVDDSGLQKLSELDAYDPDWGP